MTKSQTMVKWKPGDRRYCGRTVYLVPCGKTLYLNNITHLPNKKYVKESDFSVVHKNTKLVFLN